MEFQSITIEESKKTLPVYKESYDEVCNELRELSKRLLGLLPDPSIGPEERLERLARIQPHSILNSMYRKTARVKLRYLRHRLNELLPDETLSAREKLERLVEKVESQNQDLKGKPLFEILERMGDCRISDIGV